jgi:hypothetical protein
MCDTASEDTFDAEGAAESPRSPLVGVTLYIPGDARLIEEQVVIEAEDILDETDFCPIHGGVACRSAGLGARCLCYRSFGDFFRPKSS